MKHEAKCDLKEATRDKDVRFVPIIFNHGITSSASAYQQLMIEMASHGYIVFGIDSLSGSCGYTEKEDGTKVYFDSNNDISDVTVRLKQID